MKFLPGWLTGLIALWAVQGSLVAAEPTDAAVPAAAVPVPVSAPLTLLPRPLELQPDIEFWIRVYSEISTNEGFIHDQRNLAVIYQKLSFAPGQSPRERQEQVDALRERYQDILRYLVSGGSPRDTEDQRVRELWSATTTMERLSQAVDDVRFQLGQSDRFRAGLERAGRWESHIARTLADTGLPPELAALPHVESSFDPSAYSKVGAAGLWQFMRPTGRRYLRIDNLVDERLDPFRASEAAAQLLAYNFRALGTWPLAITAYNHGAAGMRRARDSMGTDDIVRIVREYNSPLFGFASRNFYVSFLAALTIDQNPAKYFGALQTQPALQLQQVKLETASLVADLSKATGTDVATLTELNPGWRAPVQNGTSPVPAGVTLYLPAGAQRWTSATLTARLNSRIPAPVVVSARRSRPMAPVVAKVSTPSLLPGAEATANADALDYSVADDNSIRVAAEETLGHYADWLGQPASRLRVINGMGNRAQLRFGGRVKLDLAHVDKAVFERKRRAYHQMLEESYFAHNQIVGTQNYVTRPGDTMFSLVQKMPLLTLWLLQQYNPDVNLMELRVGTQVVLPKIEQRS
jgi:hypothetical protein